VQNITRGFLGTNLDYSYFQFEVVPRDTGQTEFAILLNIGGVAFNVAEKCCANSTSIPAHIYMYGSFLDKRSASEGKAIVRDMGWLRLVGSLKL